MRPLLFTLVLDNLSSSTWIFGSNQFFSQGKRWTEAIALFAPYGHRGSRGKPYRCTKGYLVTEGLKPDKVTEITTFANVLCRTTLTSFPACATTAYLASSSSIPFLVQYQKVSNPAYRKPGP